MCNTLSQKKKICYCAFNIKNIRFRGKLLRQKISNLSKIPIVKCQLDELIHLGYEPTSNIYPVNSLKNDWEITYTFTKDVFKKK